MMRVAIFGAGAIGGYLAQSWTGALGAQGITLDVIGRRQMLDALAPKLAGAGLHENANCLTEAQVICVTVKATGLDETLQQIKAQARHDAVVAVFMNGLEPARRARAVLETQNVVAGMVPFNVVWEGDTLRRSSAGDLAVEPDDWMRRLADAVSQTDAPLQLTDRIEAQQYGKLLLNLINPINALSGLGLREMLIDRDYRLLVSDVIAEALAVYDAAGVDWVKVGPFSPRIARKLMRLPTWLFALVILPVQKIDAGSRTSMASDVLAGKPTEVDSLNGEIVRLAAAQGMPAPLNAGLVRLVKTAQPDVQMSVAALRDRL